MENINLINFSFWIIIKILFLIALGLYIIFSFVITRQVKIMTDTLVLGFEGMAKLLALLNLVFAIIVFIAALTVL